MSKLDDRLLSALLLQISKGNRQGFLTFYVSTSEMLTRYIFKRVKDHALCADLLQETYTALWRYRHTIKSVEIPLRYLFKIGDHAIYRSQRQQTRFRDVDHNTTLPFYPEYEMNHDCTQLREKWLDVVNCLPPKQRDVYQLVVMEELSHKDAGRVLNLAIPTINNYLTIAHKKVRKQLGEFYPVY